MSDESPYPECRDCDRLIDDHCKGVVSWLLCGYLTREFIENFRPKIMIPRGSINKKEEHMFFKINLVRTDSKGGRIEIEGSADLQGKLKEMYTEMEEVMESWDKEEKNGKANK